MKMAIDNDIVVIEPKSTSLFKNLHDIWKYKKLLCYLCGRFARAMYKDTVLGWLWIVLRALIPAVVSTIVFGEMAKVPSDDIPYILFFFTGISLWNLFGNSMRIITRSIRMGKRFIMNLYFPRILIPIASLWIFMIQFLVYMVLLGGIILYFYFAHNKLYLVLEPQLFLSFYYIFLTILFTLGIGFFTSILNTQARDVRFSVPYLVNMFFFITPVLYPLSLVPEKWRWIAVINPMSSVIEGFKWSLLGKGEINLYYQLFSAFSVILIFLAGVWFFTRAEITLSDNM